MTRGPAKPISAFGFGDHHVADEGEGGRHATHGRVGQDRDEGQAGIGKLGQRGRGLGHLHQRKEAFLHARAARCGDADEGQFLLDRDLHATHEALAEHRAHRSAHEIELEGAATTGKVLMAPCMHDQRIRLAGGLVGLHQTIRVALGILEFQRVDRHDLGADLETALRVEQQIQALRANPGGCGGRTSDRPADCFRGRWHRAPPRTTGTCSTVLRAAHRAVAALVRA